jgi:hypothetical protein
MEVDIKVINWQGLDMDLENFLIKTEVIIKDSGKTVRWMDMLNYITQMDS